MSNKHVFHFGFLELMDTYAVVTCNEGVEIDKHEVEAVQKVLGAAYSGKTFGLIANRVNLYSVNPIAIKKLFTLEELVAGAIVGRSVSAKIIAEFEARVIAVAPIKYFEDMPQAVEWIENLVREGTDVL